MDRRAFFRMTLRGRERVLELSCERLHVRWVDAEARSGVPGSGALGGRGAGAVDGEPPLDVRVPTRVQLMAELEKGLTEVDVLKVTGREWLEAGEFGREVASRIQAFGRRGGRVE
jgi:hypothetical protein